MISDVGNRHIYFSLLESVCEGLGRTYVLAGRMDLAIAQIEKAIDLNCHVESDSFFDLLVAEAERFMHLADFYEAIRIWQDIASLLGAQTPEYVYHRLSEAYALNHDHFGGSTQENFCWGDRDKLAILAEIHQRLKPEFYLEIGVDQGKSLALARCRAIGIDARPDLQLAVPLGDQTTLVALSSDAFFRDGAAFMLQHPPDFAFIDGLHFFEFALRIS